MKKQFFLFGFIFLFLNTTILFCSCEKETIEPQLQSQKYFSGQLKPVSAHWVGYTDTTITFKFLDMLKEAGVNIIYFAVFADEWETHKTYYKEVAQRIKQDNLKLHISYYIGDCQNTNQNYHEYIDFQEYKDREMLLAPDMVGKLQPDYFQVVVEPKTVELRGNVNISDNQWVELVTDVGNKIKQQSPNTKIIAGTTGFHDELELFQRFSTIEVVDVVGTNPYAYAITDVTITNIINEVNTNKPVWFVEAWASPSEAKLALMYPNLTERVQVETDYLNIAFDFMIENEIEYICPFYTFQFLTYSLDESDRLNALNSNERTELFYLYKDFIGINK